MFASASTDITPLQPLHKMSGQESNAFSSACSENMLPLCWCAAVSCAQIAAKLQLVSAFVAAHTIAQEVFSSHLAGKAEQSSSTAKNNGHSQQGSAAGDSGTEVEVADRVLQESRAEADAALQYAHKVSTTSFTRNKHSCEA